MDDSAPGVDHATLAAAESLMDLHLQDRDSSLQITSTVNSLSSMDDSAPSADRAAGNMDYTYTSANMDHSAADTAYSAADAEHCASGMDHIHTSANMDHIDNSVDDAGANMDSIKDTRTVSATQSFDQAGPYSLTAAQHPPATQEQELECL